MAYSDRRAEPRLKVHFLAQISGEVGSCEVRGVNITSGGALLLATKPLPPESVVLLQAKSLGLMGFAQVRHCAERGANSYAIGVGFPSPPMRMGTWRFQRVSAKEFLSSAGPELRREVADDAAQHAASGQPLP